MPLARRLRAVPLTFPATSVPCDQNCDYYYHNYDAYGSTTFATGRAMQLRSVSSSARVRLIMRHFPLVFRFALYLLFMLFDIAIPAF